jgi:hypothetical protein
VHHLDFLDICAILLGISFTVAKLDAQGRKAEGFPHVRIVDFERWREWTVSIYRLGSGMCFFRVLFHQGWAYYLGRQVLAPAPGANPAAAPPGLMYPAMAIDAVFLGVLASTFIRASRARALRRELGIVLAPLTPQQAAALAPDNEGEPSAKNDD